MGSVEREPFGEIIVGALGIGAGEVEPFTGMVAAFAVDRVDNCDKIIERTIGDTDVELVKGEPVSRAMASALEVGTGEAEPVTVTAVRIGVDRADNGDASLNGSRAAPTCVLLRGSLSAGP